MFDVVYKITIESSNLEELKNKLEKFDLDLDARTTKKGLIITAGTQLAREGNAKVKWLRQLGASVDMIAQGYALAGYHDQVKKYREKYKASVHYIAQGYAGGGYHDQVEAYHEKYKADVNDIAKYYALGGYHDQAETYREKHKANVDYIAKGYALGGYHDQVETYREKYKADVVGIAQCYARAGYHDQVEEYRTKHGVLPEGHKKIERQKQYDNINCLLDSYLKGRTAMTDSSGETKEYFYGSLFSVLQKSFTQKKNAVNALKSALEGHNVNLSEHLSTLRNGNLGNELRAFIKLGLGNALAGQEVTTVSDFVQALQDKNSNQAQPS